MRLHSCLTVYNSLHHTLKYQEFIFELNKLMQEAQYLDASPDQMFVTVFFFFLTDVIAWQDKNLG